MTSFPGSPRLSKGAIIGLGRTNPLPIVTVFQYNPKSMTRSVQPRAASGEGSRNEVLRLNGAPTETITISELEIDATDQMELSDPVTAAMGIYPQLSALETLLYPEAAEVVLNSALLALGTIEILPSEAPLTLFAWGVKRILPVRITSLSITEQEYSPDLNPIRATVSLTMQVLSYNDFPAGHAGNSLFLAHQVAKEVMAGIGSARSAASGLTGFFSS